MNEHRRTGADANQWRGSAVDLLYHFLKQVIGTARKWPPPNEKRHLRLRPDYLCDPRSPRRRRQVDVVLGPALATPLSSRCFLVVGHDVMGLHLCPG